jgi:hypothetical protein
MFESKTLTEMFFFRLLKHYYEKRILEKGIADSDDAFPDLKVRDSCLPLESTLPSFILISGVGLLPFLLTPTGRKAYAALFVLGSLISIGWMKVKKAA